ncbi:hypothetical protein GOBAR_AA39795 [Gossypium barbadense]|uniref:Kazal-like domain-containing protein n=1 Tax=Gossypium barbadense TaxID=3634 RepID=A0A2P5VPZ3_GOSBA|nr:hypothetical protein GOBAR_AA39795 [Gossypium barbadense]
MAQQRFSAIRLPSEVDPCTSSPRPNFCPANCFMADPVCGDNGVTYWCGCADAYCAGTKVARIGFCESDRRARQVILENYFQHFSLILEAGKDNTSLYYMAVLMSCQMNEHPFINSKFP